jgi:hypothetical protein
LVSKILLYNPTLFYFHCSLFLFLRTLYILYFILYYITVFHLTLYFIIILYIPF